MESFVSQRSSGKPGTLPYWAHAAKRGPHGAVIIVDTDVAYPWMYDRIVRVNPRWSNRVMTVFKAEIVRRCVTQMIRQIVGDAPLIRLACSKERPFKLTNLPQEIKGVTMQEEADRGSRNYHLVYGLLVAEKALSR